MELISCPECQAQISSAVDTCPNCGYPLKKIESASDKNIATESIKEKIEKVKVNTSKIQVRGDGLNKVLAVLMLVIALLTIKDLFSALGGWFGNFIDYGPFNFFALVYFSSVIRNVLIIVGFATTGTILLTNKKEYLKTTLFIIFGCYAFGILQNICLVLWLGPYRIILGIICMSMAIVWGVLLFTIKGRCEDEYRVKRNVLTIVAAVLFLINIIAIVKGVYYFDTLTLCRTFVEYAVLALVIWMYPTLNTNEIINNVADQNPMDEIRMESMSTSYTQEKVYTNIENINGYVKIWKVIVFSILTLGIYPYVWIYRTVGLFNNKRIGEERSQGIQVVLCMFVPFYIIYWLYKQSKLTEEYTILVGNRSNDLAVLSIILSVFGLSLVAMALIQDAINKNLMTEYGGGTKQEENITPQRDVVVTVEPQAEEKNVIVHSSTSTDRISDVDIEYLKKLKELYDLGILSEDEYKVKKEKVLGI